MGAGESNATTLTAAAGDQDLFAARYNANGVLQWARIRGDTAFEDSGPVAAFGDGSVVMSSGTPQGVPGFRYFVSTLERRDGSGVLQWKRTVTDPESLATLNVRYSNDGAILWVRVDELHSNVAFLQPVALVAAPGGSCLCVGTYTSGIPFGTGETRPVPVSTAHLLSDIYVTRFNADGKY